MPTGVRFPAILPIPTRDGYSETYRESRSEVEMDSGLPRRRIRFRNPPKLIDLRWEFSQDEFHVFDYWWQVDIAGGSIEFDVQLLDDDDVVWYTVAVVGEYKAEVDPVMNWQVTLKVSAKENHFGSIRESGTDELSGKSFVKLSGAGNLLIPRTVRGNADLGLSAHAQLNPPPLRGSASFGLSNNPRARFTPEAQPLGHADLGLSAIGRLNPFVLHGGTSLGILGSGKLNPLIKLYGSSSPEITSSALIAEDFASSTILLLHLTGSDGSTSIVDSSVNARTVTIVDGGVEISTSDAAFGGSSAEFFASPGSTLTKGLTLGVAGSITEYASFNDGPWTIRGWMKVRYPGPQYATAFAIEWQNISNGEVLGLSYNFANFGTIISPSWTGNNVLQTPSIASELMPPPNEWFHFAFTKDVDGKNRCYINGKSVVRRIESSVLVDWFYGGGFIHADATISIGKSIISGALDGYLQEFSIHDEVLYTADFDPPRYAAIDP